MKSNYILDNLIIGRVEPHIYAFTTETIPNYLKVGDTYRPVYERIEEWKKKYPNLMKKDDWEWQASVGEKEKKSYFRDISVHKYLESDKNKHRLEKTEISKDVYFSNEFFKNTKVKDVYDAIKDIGKNFKNNTFKYDFYKFDGDTRLRQEEHYKRSDKIWELRNNQKDVVDNFTKAIKNGRNNLLMYAVMRFGKSFTSLCCVKKYKEMFNKKSVFVVVVSAKADIKDEWKQNVEVPLNFEDFVFLDSNNLAQDKNIIKKTLNKNINVVCFLTLQDLQGDNIKNKHKELFLESSNIDILLIDETHFGARAEAYGKVLENRETNEKIAKFDKSDINKDNDGDYVEEKDAEKVIKTLKSKIRIHLSGTPYKILMGSEFEKEDIIAFCQFDDIIDAKNKWNEDNINKDEKETEWKNPYYGFPQMIRFACNPNKKSKEILIDLDNKGVKYKYSELLKTYSIEKDEKNNTHKKFVHKEAISDLLMAIDGAKNDTEIFSFLNYDKIKKGFMCRHMVMVLPYCASCDAMEALINSLKKSKKLKNLQNYKIINISGVDNQSKYKKVIDVKNEISNAETSNQKTLTLTVNRMLTGVTVKEWDTMIYFKDTASPQEYDQAIFRLQNQYIKEYKDKNGNLVKIDMKPQTLLVDFEPGRMFRMQENKSFIYNVNVDKSGNNKIEERINKDLKISPIIKFDENGITRVTPANIMEEVANYSKNRGVADEVQEIPIDMSLLKNDKIKDMINKENEIGSNKGLSFEAHTGDGTDLDGEIENEDVNDIGNKNKDNFDNKESDNTLDDSIRKKFMNVYSRILFYAFLTKSNVKSLEDILNSIKQNDDNERIFENLGLDYKILGLVFMLIDKFVLSKLDYKIQNLNKLSREQENTLESAYVAIRKFGRLGISEVVTPEKIADKMVSFIDIKDYKQALENDNKMLDVASKMGEFAISFVKLFESKKISKSAYYDCIYSICTSSIAYEFTRKIYEILDLDVKCIAKNFYSEDLLKIKTNDDKNIDYKRIDIILSQNTDFCNIELDDIVSKEDKKVKFDVVVGNPPYQEDDGGAQASARPIYQLFVNISKAISNRYMSIIMPSRWYAGGKGLDEFRDEMLSDKHIVHINDYLHPEEYFPDANNRGGVCNFIWDLNYDNKNSISVDTHYKKEEIVKSHTELKSDIYSIFIRNGQSLEILKKVIPSKDVDVIEQHISSRKPFGIESNIVKTSLWKNKDFKSSIKCLGKGEKIGYIKKTADLSNNELINIYKVFTPRANNIGTELNDDNFNTIIGEPGTICTEAYLVIGIGLNMNKIKCKNICKYFQTKFARFMHGLAKASHDASKKTYCYIPTQDFTNSGDIDWSKEISGIDKQLYKKYKLSKNEIAFIEKNIKPMS